jgi:DNA-binding PadR family transcriptional regulator
MIQLLNGEKWSESELLTKMEDDTFYYGHLGKHALSSSSIKLLNTSPKKYYYVTKYGQSESQALRDGWLFHTSILEPEVFSRQIFVDVQSKNTKKYKEALAEHGKVFTMKEKSDAERLQDAFFKNEQALELITNCQFEVPAVGLIDDIPFRGKADVLSKKGIVDLKTTTDINAFPYSAKKYGYDVQVYIYCQLFNVPYDDFKFVALDKGTLDIAIYDVSEDFYLEGERKTLEAIDRYRMFFMEGADLNSYTMRGTL